MDEEGRRKWRELLNESKETTNEVSEGKKMFYWRVKDSKIKKWYLKMVSVKI